jgi:hypothetical protein
VEKDDVVAVAPLVELPALGDEIFRPDSAPGEMSRHWSDLYVCVVLRVAEQV